MATEQDTMSEFGDFIEIAKRRKAQIITPFLLILSIAAALAFFLPPVYQSTATILIEQQEIPQDLVKSTVTSYADERIQLIGKRVMTSTNLWKIIEKFDLYSEYREQGETGLLISTMRKAILVDMVSADVFRGGRASKATIAFELSFEYDEAEAAQSVTKELVRLFLAENVKIRTQKAEMTSEFLGGEAERLSETIKLLEARLAVFKERNVGRLPELMQLNMTRMENSQKELEDVEAQLSLLQERRMSIESQLAYIDPFLGDSPAGRLRELQSNYMNAMARYSPDHPDVVRLKREVEALKRQTGVGDDTNEIAIQIKQTKAQLKSAQEKYSNDHPDVVKLKRSLRSLTNALENARPSNNKASQLPPDNPAYIAMKSQLNTVLIGIKSQKDRRERVKLKARDYEERLMQTPRVEQEGLLIKRDYDNAVKKYQEIKDKQLQAQISEQLEFENKGERFSLLEPANLPTTPIRPNRLGILLLGSIVAVGVGIGYAAIVEFMDRSVRGINGVTLIAKAAPLAVIPYIRNNQDLRRKRNRIIFKSVIFILILLLVVGGYLYLLPMFA